MLACNPLAKSEATANDEPATPPKIGPSKSWAILKRRTPWLIGALLAAGACGFAYHWAFGKAKYATTAVERGDVESTVVAAGILLPPSLT
jgi:uncharacterized protein involved in exopolysaccharide biosynthesis